MGGLIRLFLPLSFSDLIMVLAGPIIISGLTRLPNQEVHLAAYGVTEAVAILIESPIIMLLHAATALSRDRAAFQSLKRLMWLANGAVTLLYAAFAFTPLYDGLFRIWLDQPAAVADAARPAFQLMLLWPAAIGWRRFYQGMLIAQKRTAKVGLASFFRLGSLTLTVIIGVLMRLPGAIVAALALQASVIVEGAAVQYFASQELRRYVWGEPVASNPHSLKEVTVYYMPLALTAVLVWAAKPAINGGIARTAGAGIALAAWPAVWTTISLVGNAIRAVQQMVITQANSRANYRLLTHFTWWAGIAASVAMAVIGWSGAGGTLLTQVTGLSGALAAVAVPALRLGALYPLEVAWQNHLQGLLIRDGKTGRANLCALVGSGGLFVTILAGVALGWPGAVLGAAAAVVGQAAEIAALLFTTRRERAAVIQA